MSNEFSSGPETLATPIQINRIAGLLRNTEELSVHRNDTASTVSHSLELNDEPPIVTLSQIPPHVAARSDVGCDLYVSRVKPRFIASPADGYAAPALQFDFSHRTPGTKHSQDVWHVSYTAANYKPTDGKQALILMKDVAFSHDTTPPGPSSTTLAPDLSIDDAAYIQKWEEVTGNEANDLIEYLAGRAAALEAAQYTHADITAASFQ